MRQRIALFLFLCFFAGSVAQAQPQREYIVVVGGPSSFRAIQGQSRTIIGGNFVHWRADDSNAFNSPDAMLTWLVYKPGYVDRGRRSTRPDREHQQRDKFHLNLVYF
jgi:hypothetical protein